MSYSPGLRRVRSYLTRKTTGVVLRPVLDLIVVTNTGDCSGLRIWFSTIFDRPDVRCYDCQISPTVGDATVGVDEQ